MDIGSFVVRSLNYGFRSGQLSITQRQGIITCIPKKGKDKRFLQNWRPITLLNTSYKLASACTTFRIKSLLPQIIHGDQTGFLAGRYIGENIRMLYDILFHTETHNIPGQLLLVEYHKAFDSLSWSFIEQFQSIEPKRAMIIITICFNLCFNILFHNFDLPRHF